MPEVTGTNAATIPDVSILMTAYNSAQYLPEAIESILAQQSARTWELLLVDDGSDDDTFAVAQRYRRRASDRIRILQHPNRENRGISASRNLALRHARGRLLTFLDSDDVWLPWHIETQATLLDGMPDVDMVYAGAERWVHFDRPFDEAASRSAAWGDNYLPPLLPPGQPAGLLPRGKLIEWFRQDESLVPCICTVMLHTRIALEVGGFCDEFRGLYDDQVFHVRVAQRYNVYANDRCVARYRQHAASCCSRARESDTAAARERERFVNLLRS